MQYPMRSVLALKDMIEPSEGVIFVDNEQAFRSAIHRSRMSDYFFDLFGGDFGHCTEKGNQLMAQNITRTLMHEVFSRIDKNE